MVSTLKSQMVTSCGATRIQLRASACGVVKVLIPFIMETPYVGVRMGIVCTCWVDWSKIYFE